MLDFKDFISEGLQDPATFKAIMMAGGAGSGKSRMVSDTAVQAFGMRLSNSDPAFEQGLKKAGLKLNSKDIMSAQGQAIRMVAKKLTDKQKEIIQRWFNTYILMYNSTIQYIKQNYKEVLDQTYIKIKAHYHSFEEQKENNLKLKQVQKPGS